MDVQVSVLIPTRDRPRTVRRCIDSVLAQEEASYEVLVFDDASVRGDMSSLNDAYGDHVRLLQTEQPVGAAASRNRLAQQARGRHLVYLDDDAYLEDPTTLAQVADIFESHPEAGILAFRIMERVNGSSHLRVPFPRWRIWRRPHAADEPALVSVFLGGGYAVRNRVMSETGGYESFLRYMGEEQDLAFKALEKKYKIRYTPEISVVHETGPPVKNREGEKSRLFYNVRNRAYLARRYLPVQYLPSYLLYWLVVYAGFAIASGDMKGYARGIWASGRQWRSWDRSTLSRGTQQYLRRHGGHLWF